MQQNTPKLTTLYLYITNLCNLNCRHCWINPSFTKSPLKIPSPLWGATEGSPEYSRRKGKGEGETLLGERVRVRGSTASPLPNGERVRVRGNIQKGIDLKLLTDTLEQCRELGMRSLKITGGEPLLYDSFMGLLEYFKKKKWNLFLQMETNGTMIDKKMARALKEGGMKFISVSIDGDNPETHDTMRGVKGSFTKAWQAAKEMIEAGIPVQIITAVYRGNVGQFKNIAKMAEEIKAESIKANMITTMGRGAKMSENGELLSIGEMLELSKKIEDEYRKKFKIRVLSSLPVAFRSFKRMLKERTGFCRIKGLLGILATGKVSICGIGEEIEELILGDARKDSIKEIWQTSSLLWSIRNNLPSKLDGVCKICIFNNYCLGHCVAQSYYSTGSLTSPFWVCQKAYEHGLFPSSRLLN